LIDVAFMNILEKRDLNNRFHKK